MQRLFIGFLFIHHTHTVHKPIIIQIKTRHHVATLLISLLHTHDFTVGFPGCDGGCSTSLKTPPALYCHWKDIFDNWPARRSSTLCASTVPLNKPCCRRSQRKTAFSCKKYVLRRLVSLRVHFLLFKLLTEPDSNIFPLIGCFFLWRTRD